MIVLGEGKAEPMNSWDEMLNWKMKLWQTFLGNYICVFHLHSSSIRPSSPPNLQSMEILRIEQSHQHLVPSWLKASNITESRKRLAALVQVPTVCICWLTERTSKRLRGWGENLVVIGCDDAIWLRSKLWEVDERETSVCYRIWETWAKREVRAWTWQLSNQTAVHVTNIT